MFMILDYITAIIRCVFFQKRKFIKKIAVNGLMKKISYITIVIVGFLLDYTFNIVYPAYNNDYIGLFCIIYMISIELSSLCKNWLGMGIPVPPVFTKLNNILKNILKKILKNFEIEGEDKK